MAVRQRQTGACGGRAFNTRLPQDVYNTIEDFAWENRMTFALAVNVLLTEAVNARKGGNPNAEIKTDPEAQSAKAEDSATQLALTTSE